MVQANTTNEAASATDSNIPLPGFIAIVMESIAVYRRLWRPLVKLQFFANVVALGAGILAGVAFAFIVVAVSGSGSIAPAAIMAIIVLGVACLIALLLLMFWAEAAAIVVLREANENISISQALNSAKRYVASCMLVNLFTLLAVFFGMLFFIIPGLIFAVWLMFASYIIVVENQDWLAAIQRSRDYTRGSFWNVLLLAALGTVSILFVNSFFDVFKSLPMGGVLKFIADLFFAPMYPIYLFLLYSNLRKSRTNITVSGLNTVKTSGKKFTFLIGLAGLLAAFAAIGIAVYYAPQLEEYGRKTIDEYNRINPERQFPVLPQGIKLQ